MLTIRHVEPNGNDDVYPASEAHVLVSADRPKTVWFLKDGTRHEYTTGMVYVMNEFGKTIVIYELAWKK